MPQYFSPGVYVEEVDSGPRPIQGASTSVTGMVGVTLRGPTQGKPVLVTSFNEFQRRFGGFHTDPESALKQKWEDKAGQAGVWWRFPNAVRGFFDNGGQQLYVKRVVSEGAEPSKKELEREGVIAEIVADATKDARTLKLRHVIGVTGDGQTVKIFNGQTDTKIGDDMTVDSYEAGTTESSLTLSAGIGKEVLAGRGDYVRIVGKSTTTPAKVLSIKANSEGTWGDQVYTRVRPAVSTALTLLVHQDADAEFGSGTLALKSQAPAAGATRSIELRPGHSLKVGDMVRINDGKYTLVGDVVQQLSLTPDTDLTGGGIKVKFKDVEAAGLLMVDGNEQITAASLQAALVGLSNIGAGDVVCSAGPLPGTPIKVAFQGTLGGQALPSIEITQNTLAPTASVDVADITNVFKEVKPHTADDGKDWNANTLVQKLRAASLTSGGNADEVFVSGAGRLYKGAMIELDNGKAKKFAKVTAVDGDKVTLDAALTAANQLYEDDVVHVIEAEVEARYTSPGGQEVTELFDNLKLVAEDPDDAFLIGNRVGDRSQLIEAEPLKKPNGDVLLTNSLADFPGLGHSRFAALTGGGDAYDELSVDAFIGRDGGSGNRTGVKALEDIEDISIVAAPGMWARSIVNELTRHCEAMRYRMAVLDAPLATDISEVQQFRARFDSKYAALYYPWVKVRQPGVAKDVVAPPSAFLAGLYGDVDTRRGVHKAPANEVLKGVTEINQDITRREQDLLNPKGINALRFFPGRGNRVWGARTISSDSNFRYVNVRRIFNFIEASIDAGTQFVVFEPNDATLWARVRQTVKNFLNTQWRAGMLEGASPDEAYFVECDRGATMTQDDIENGRLICEIGIAPVFPAEFVIFRIQKYTAESKLA